jgi:hypothetical protein
MITLQLACVWAAAATIKLIAKPVWQGSAAGEITNTSESAG